ncbi:hypothetical protein GTW51_13610 [Aurantimonas aggregata]|uniref:Uncharacterized protein n=1 Tax=Aurantimonas aggregata TaxID=2047720 RepID=A0A6L9MJC7_9HYPH|nr:hypothetical protein [Aurantimonas aggregata]NDV87738.1 hypothetical protein [Aurantimonas aggregata]
MSTRFLKQYVLPSDGHAFVGRIYDLSIIGLHFETYDELSKHDDCKYAYDVNQVLSMLTRRVESLNMVGGMLWPSSMPDSFKQFPVSRYEWLTICADVFLARYVSVVDCAMILVSQVFECTLAFEACTAQNLKKKSIPGELLAHLVAMIDDQGDLRHERNRRFHHGLERRFSSDDQVFLVASLFEHRFSGAVGPNGRALPVERLYREGLVELQREFNAAMKKLVRQLNWLYDALHPEFDRRFSPKFRAGSFARKGAE